MEGILFTLVNERDHGQVYAWGMEIVSYHRATGEVASRVAVVYRFDPVGGGSTHGVHGSAEEACRFHRRLADLDLVWQDPCVAALETAMPQR